MEDHTGLRWPTLLADVTTLGTVGLVIAAIEKTVRPTRRGFFCDDESIRLPTITDPVFNSKSLAALCIFISFTTVDYFSLIGGFGLFAFNVFLNTRTFCMLIICQAFLVLSTKLLQISIGTSYKGKFGVRTLNVLEILYFCIGAGSGGIILLIFFTAVSPTRRGIYCEDESIQYPFKNSTIPNYLLYIYGFAIPLLVIIATEIVMKKNVRRSIHFLCRPCPIWVFAVYRDLVDFLFGVAASQLVTDVGKYSIGRLRPNFIHVCQPNITFTNCDQYEHRYIQDYVCLARDDDAVYSRVSFPSGHSSFSAYTMLYTAIFIQIKWRSQAGQLTRSFRLVKHGVQILLIILAYFTALSRVMDNKHHWSDALVGTLIGIIAAALTAKYVSKLDPRREQLQILSSKEPNGQNEPGKNFRNLCATEEEELRSAQRHPNSSNEHVTPRKTAHVEFNLEDTPSSASALLMSSPETSIN